MANALALFFAFLCGRNPCLAILAATALGFGMTMITVLRAYGMFISTMDRETFLLIALGLLALLSVKLTRHAIV